MCLRSTYRHILTYIVFVSFHFHVVTSRIHAFPALCTFTQANTHTRSPLYARYVRTHAGKSSRRRRLASELPSTAFKRSVDYPNSGGRVPCDSQRPEPPVSFDHETATVAQASATSPCQCAPPNNKHIAPHFKSSSPPASRTATNHPRSLSATNHARSRHTHQAKCTIT